MTTIAYLSRCLRPGTVAVCRRQSGMLFCDRTTEKQFFGR